MTYMQQKELEKMLSELEDQNVVFVEEALILLLDAVKLLIKRMLDHELDHEDG